MLPEEPLISIVVPIYRAEAYLDRCVKGLLAQTYPHFELILVDDGSPDACPRLCDAWAERDGRVRVLHKPNGGQAEARNQGVRLAKGAYISFVDADDYVSPDHLAYLLGLLRDQEADIACGGYRIVYDGGEAFDRQPPEQVRRLDREEACLALMDGDDIRFITPWAKLLPRRLVLDNPFPLGHLHEDEATSYRYFYEGGVTAVGSRVIYAYFQNRQSLSHSRTRRDREDVLRAFEEQILYFERQGSPRLQLAAARRYISTLVYHAAKGDPVSREILADGRERPYFLPGLDAKVKLRYWGYRLLGLDLTEQLRLLKEKLRRASRG